MKRKANIDFARSPTLDTVMMIEKGVKDYSGEHQRKIWQMLPKKVMWQTYIFTLAYLKSINKIAFDRKNHAAYIWDPKGAKRYMKRAELEWKPKKYSLQKRVYRKNLKN
jgi:hypothetical protein